MYNSIRFDLGPENRVKWGNLEHMGNLEQGLYLLL